METTCFEHHNHFPAFCLHQTTTIGRPITFLIPTRLPGGFNSKNNTRDIPFVGHFFICKTISLRRSIRHDTMRLPVISNIPPVASRSAPNAHARVYIGALDISLDDIQFCSQMPVLQRFSEIRVGGRPLPSWRHFLSERTPIVESAIGRPKHLSSSMPRKDPYAVQRVAVPFLFLRSPLYLKNGENNNARFDSYFV